jgi:hypothetical protein
VFNMASSSGPSSFEAYLSYFQNMEIDELVDFLSNSVPHAGLSESSLAFL